MPNFIVDVKYLVVAADAGEALDLVKRSSVYEYLQGMAKPEEPEKKPYWASWWSEMELPYYSPFRIWVTGYSGKKASYCACIESESAQHVTTIVRRLFQDADMRFCDEKPKGWTPESEGDRFQ